MNLVHVYVRRFRFILFSYSKLVTNFSLPAGRRPTLTRETHMSPMKLEAALLSWQESALPYLSLCHLCAVAFNWNGKTLELFLQVDSSVYLSLLHRGFHRGQLVASIFQRREIN